MSTAYRQLRYQRWQAASSPFACAAGAPSRLAGSTTIALMLLLMLLAAGGCTRTRYRQRADQEVSGLIQEKSNDPRWEYPNFDVYVDPRSRYYDHTSIDRPPMPLDDPASHEFMHYLDGKRHWPHWHDNGDRPDLENPAWLKLLPTYVETTERGEVKLNVDSAMKLTLIHSPDYRQQIETLYLSALDVSTERFRFVTQFYGGKGLLFGAQGRDINPAVGEQNRLSIGNDVLTNLGGSNTRMTRRIATGGELLVGFANSMVWQFAGPDQYTNISILNFNFVQPLLRFGGRAVALEQLTIAERNLLANLRSFQRYRQGLYTNVVVGDLNVTGPQRRGGFLGGTGLTGFSGQGSGGFGEVGSATNFGRAGFGAANQNAAAGATGAGFAGGGAGSVGGFLGLLQSAQQIRNTDDSLNLQLRTLKLLEANLAAGLIDIVQVDQFRQNIQTERANLLQAQINLDNALDTFKRQTIGLPPSLPMQLDDGMIRQFQFIDPQTTAYQNALADFVESLGDLPVEPTEAEVGTAIDRFASLRDDAQARFAQTRDDLQKLEAAVPARERLMASDADKVAFTADRQKLHVDLQDLDARFQASADDLDALRQKLAAQPAKKSLEELVGLGTSLSGLVGELSLVQARARLETVTVEPIELRSEQALEIARNNRLDWMNNRATLVDTWRLITFNANALRSNLQVTVSGDIATDGNSQFRFQAPNGNLRAGLRFDAPFTRLLERNNYRQVLINYQQDRRTLIRYEDAVNQTLRQDLRSLKQLQENLEIQRRAVAIAVRRVDKTRDDLNEPPPPVQPGQPSVQLGPTASLNLLTAISDLRNSQNNFMSVWLNYYSERVQLMRDLGIMQLDENGMWVDMPIDCALGGPVDELYPLPPPVPDEWLREMGIDPRAIPPGSEILPPPTKQNDLPQPNQGAQPAWPGDAPPLRSQLPLAPPELNSPAVTPAPPTGPAESIAPPELQRNQVLQRGRLRAGAKRWVDMVRRRNGPADLESSVD